MVLITHLNHFRVRHLPLGHFFLPLEDAGIEPPTIYLPLFVLPAERVRSADLLFPE